MEKLGDEWTSNSVTSTFRVEHKDGRPTGCYHPSDRVYTKNCGLGWRFAVAYDKRSPEFDVYFDPYVTNVELKHLSVSVKLREEGSSITDFVRMEETTCSLPSATSQRIVSFLPSDIVTFPLLTFVVTFTSVVLNLPSPKGDSTVNRALSNSLRTGAFIDTRIFVFSRRLSPDRVGHPLSVYANSSILKAKSSDLYDQLSEDFTSYEGIGVDEYGYESDSDLDDLDAEEAMRSMSMSSSESCEGSHSDIQGQSPNEPVHFQSIGKTFLIKNSAFTTWQALVYYAYTGEVTFSPLRSQRSKSHVDSGTEQSSSSYAPPCSPKSMYRLAEKMGLHNLTTLAFEAIRSRLSEANILDESFSRFTARHPMVQEMELALLCEHYHSPEVMPFFPKKMESVAEGKLPHCSKILTSLFNKLEPCANGTSE